MSRAGHMRWLGAITASTLLLYALLQRPAAAGVVVIPASLFVSLHLLIEVVSVVMSLTVGLTAWHVLDGRDRRASRALAGGFLIVGAMDTLHLMSYAGMPDLLTPNDPHKAILFWLFARLAAVLSLLAWSFSAARPGIQQPAAKPWGTTSALAAAAVLAAWALAAPHSFPAMFVSGAGLTALKQGAEVVLIGLYLLAWYGAERRLARLPPGPRADETPVRDALVLMTLAEGFFTMYSDQVTDAANALGHVYKVTAYALLFRGMFLNQIRRPYRDLAMALQSLERHHAEHRDLIELAPDGILVADDRGRILGVNRALEDLLGHGRTALVGQPIETLIPPAMRPHHRERIAGYFASPDGVVVRLSGDQKALHADGREIDVEVALTVGTTGEGRRLTAYISDVSYRLAHQRALEHRASHDHLTDLPNRWLLADCLERAIDTHSPRGAVFGLLLLDLDNFKAVNETQGALAGDALLVEVARRLRASLRAGDIVARLGADEFAVVVTGLNDAGSLPSVAHKIAARLVPDLVVGTSAWNITASMGLAAFPRDADDADTLLRCAELALREAKRHDRATVIPYSSALGDRLAHEIRLQARLRLALDEGSLQLHYQPQVNIRSGRVFAFEALLRWHDTQLGDVSPAEFIAVAESCGLIEAVGDQVLQMACRQLRQWFNEGHEPQLAINLSPRQFRRPGLGERIVQALHEHGLPAGCLAVEITESAVMDDPASAAAQLRSLADQGIEVHLDDFGTGHSSLARLKDFPIATIKIDRGFVRDMLHSPSDEAIVRAVITLAHTLGCSVVAEGVERAEQLAHLRRLGCDSFQGWLFSKALPADQACATLGRDGIAAIRDANAHPAFAEGELG